MKKKWRNSASFGSVLLLTALVQPSFALDILGGTYTNGTISSPLLLINKDNNWTFPKTIHSALPLNFNADGLIAGVACTENFVQS